MTTEHYLALKAEKFVVFPEQVITTVLFDFVCDSVDNM